MDLSRNTYSLWWVHNADIKMGVTAVVPIGCTVLAGFAPAGNGVAPVRELPYFSFSLRATYVPGVTLTLQTAIGDNNPAALVNWWAYVHAVSGAVETVYDMALPYGGAGSPGRILITSNYLLLTLTALGGNVTAIRFMARAWKE